MMESPALIEYFVKPLVKARDSVVADFGRYLAPDSAGGEADRWSALKVDRSVNNAARDLVSEVADFVVFSVLEAIDEGEMPLMLRTPDGDLDLRETGEGEMVGEYLRPAGWRERFSAAHYVDRFAGMELPSKESED
jgi:hypothetical protein